MSNTVYVIVKRSATSDTTVKMVTKSPSTAKEYMNAMSAGGFVPVTWYEDSKGLYGASCGNYEMTLEELV